MTIFAPQAFVLQATASNRITAPLTGTVLTGSWVTNQSLTFAMPGGGNAFRYNYLLPAQYNTGYTYPVLFYLHWNDGGMNGSSYPRDGQTLINGLAGPAFNTVAFRTNFPCIVVVPECDQTLDLSGSNGNANFGGYADSPNSGANEQATLALLKAMIANTSTFSIDATSCYITGDSLGAIGSLAHMIDNSAFWKAGMGFSDQLSRGGQPTNALFTALNASPYIAVSTPSDNNGSPFDQQYWQFLENGSTSYPQPADYTAQGVAGIRAGTNNFWYIHTPSGNPWDTYRRLSADGGQGDALYTLLFSF